MAFWKRERLVREHSCEAPVPVNLFFSNRNIGISALPYYNRCDKSVFTLCIALAEPLLHRSWKGYYIIFQCPEL